MGQISEMRPESSARLTPWVFPSRVAFLGDVSRLRRSDLEEARNVLRTLLVGPLRFTPVVEERRRGYRFEGAIALDRLGSGIVDLPPGVASPTGFDTLWTLEKRRIVDAA